MYVDDFLALYGAETGDRKNWIKKITMRCFQDSFPDPVFTHESPVNISIKFIDIAIKFKQGHVFWKYEPRSTKGILPFTYGHLRTTKRSAASKALVSSLNKFCKHQRGPSFEKQISRLRNAGYPTSLLGPCLSEHIQKIETHKGSFHRKIKCPKKEHLYTIFTGLPTR